MPSIVFYELKKILGLPVLILLAATVCILVAAPLSRYAAFPMMNGLPPDEFRAITIEYAGPLDQALADRAIADWRKLPRELYWDGESLEERARRQALRHLEKEFAATAAEADVPKAANWDAGQRLSPVLSGMAGTPPAHGYYEGWRAFLSALDTEGAWLCAALVMFGLSALFSGETASGMASLNRTLRHGRMGLAAGKLTAAGLYALCCAALCALLPLALCAALFGLDGGGLPAQYAAKAAYSLTLAQYAALRMCLFLLGALALAAVMALLSSALASVAAPAVAGTALFLAPAVYSLMKLSSPALDSVMRYMPSRFLLPDALLGSPGVAILWQTPLWQPQWLALLWAALVPLLCGVAVAVHLKTLREEPVNQE